MKSDLEISNECKMENINKIAEDLGINDEYIENYGKYKAKINLDIFDELNSKKDGKLVLVTSINPTPFGEGKTTMSIGINDALRKLNKKSIVVLREPSLGPVFGIKGGAAGGGYSQIIPMEDINLHFTGDIHAIESANNLLCAIIDNHIYQGNELKIKNVVFNRCVDLNDRALRNVTIKYDNKGLERNDKYNITVASEIMAILCLSKHLDDLKRRIGNILIGYNEDNEPIFARDLNCVGAIALLLKDAIKPNLVQTLENNPVIIHGGPFANIAHGCNSVIATKTALKLADYVVTEAGFGSDLGAEKFLDIKCRLNDIKPSAIVLVATIKALKYNAGVSKEDLLNENVKAVQDGLCNLKAHIDNLKKFNVNIVVALNKYNTDFESEIDVIKKYCESINIPFSISTAYTDGGSGAVNLAETVIKNCGNSDIKYIYNLDDSIKEKIEKLSKEIYHASNVIYSDDALKEISNLEKLGFDKLPVCIAKTQYSISDDKDKLGYPTDYDITVRKIKLYNGAGFITVLLGDILTMPGLPKEPNYEKIDIDENSKITGIF